ncbi:hypothetical protein V3C33_20715 (plasmid) [Micrococcaceae bacterium Sec5.7]
MNTQEVRAMLDALLTAIPAVVAVVASVVGVLVAIDQLTQRARMRRIAEWSKALAEEEKSPDRSEVLLRVKTWATGYVLATVLVPARLFLEAAFYCLAVPAMVIWTVSTWTSLSLSVVLAGFAALWVPLRRAIRSYLERYRIAAEYFRDGKVVAPRLTILYQMEGGTRPEFLWSALLAGGIVAASVGTGLLVGDAKNQAGALLFVIGLGLSSIGVAFIRRATPPLLHGGTHLHQSKESSPTG